MEQHHIIELANQVFEIEKKINGTPQERSLQRNLRRMNSALQAAGYFLHNPMGEPYDLTRLDCQAMVAGSSSSNLTIVEVVKPIIYYRGANQNIIIQQGKVVVDSK